MEYGAIDLHKKESQIRILTEGSAIIDRPTLWFTVRNTEIKGSLGVALVND